jgi:TatD family-associated radical SAM protein
MATIVYQVGDSLYLNLTNRCTNECPFCIRNLSRHFNQKYHLWLDHESSAEEVLTSIGDPAKHQQIVFCGYGEPTIRLETIKAVAIKLKSQHQTSNFKTNEKSQIPIIRLDTNGQANLFWGRNIVPELKGLIDSVSISLNAENAEVYQKLCRPLAGKAAYPAIFEFIKEAKKYIPQVEVSVVDLPAVDLEACRNIAKALGVNFRVRPYYEETYVR